MRNNILAGTHPFTGPVALSGINTHAGNYTLINTDIAGEPAQTGTCTRTDTYSRAPTHVCSHTEVIHPVLLRFTMELTTTGTRTHMYADTSQIHTEGDTTIVTKTHNGTDPPPHWNTHTYAHTQAHTLTEVMHLLLLGLTMERTASLEHAHHPHM